MKLFKGLAAAAVVALPLFAGAANAQSDEQLKTLVIAVPSDPVSLEPGTNKAEPVGSEIILNVFDTLVAWTAPDFKEGALRMPDFRFKPEEVTAVSTMLIGSVESGIPPAFMNYPQDQRKAIQEGWWVIKKYNCIGCHAVTPGEKPVLWSLPWFEAEGLNLPKWTDAQGVEHRGGSDRRPPTLVGEGARVDPQWPRS